MQLAALAAVLSCFASDVCALVAGSTQTLRQKACQAPALRMALAGLEELWGLWHAHIPL